MTFAVAIYLFDEVEVLDFAGPFEVFSTAARVYARRHPQAPPLFEVFTVGARAGLIRARGGLEVQPHFVIGDQPPVDLLLVPGGIVDAELRRPAAVDWIAVTARRTTITASVCTGAFLLAAAGLLRGRRATTHWEDIADLRRQFPEVEVVEGVRWVDEGNVVTAAGISAGIDVSLYLVGRLAGEELAGGTARQMDYAWVPGQS